MFGSKGVLETEYGGRVLIRGDNFYKGGNTSDLYPQGARTNIASFYDNIQNGNFSNPTVVPSVQSNLITVMGRTAAYEERTVTWDDLTNNKTKLEFDLTGLQE